MLSGAQLALAILGEGKAEEEISDLQLRWESIRFPKHSFIVPLRERAIKAPEAASVRRHNVAVRTNTGVYAIMKPTLLTVAKSR